MKRIGLTGGIATGKSTVSGILRELGVPVIDADEVDWRLSEKGNKVWKAVYDHFGSGYFLPDGEMDRKRLAEMVFSDREARQFLNQITHPLIQKEVERMLRQVEEDQNPPIAVLDVPLLIEVGWDRFVDEVWVVAIPEELQIRRLMQRNGMAEEQAMQRIKSQMSLKEKCRLADRVIDNSRTVQYTREQIIRIWKEYKALEDQECGHRKGAGRPL